MAKKIKLELTEAQFLAVVDIANTIEGTLGGAEEYDKEQNKNLLLFDRMMNKNGYKR